MSQKVSPEVKCSCCNGQGHRELHQRHHETYLVGKRLTKSQKGFTSFQLAEATGLSHSNAHHRIKRLVSLGAFAQIEDASPAKYRAV